uniref:VLIG-type G domain-containing protein n=1 Tax=Lates calcarifer TaxID=8187 RepID=A0A4W6FFN2_LATCA
MPWCFLKKLFNINAECRNCAQLSNNENGGDVDDEAENNDWPDADIYTADDFEDTKINPLDLIVALFLCADSFLQQEITLKMSMCQFPVPLLLPHGNNSQCTLMLWALRDIVKEWRPHDLSESRGFVEENIVQANIPFYSFVRLKNCSLSKSQFLNHVLSRGQQNNNIFIHRYVEGGGVKRKIANGLVEACWYLPCGTEDLDIFPEPAAFANLRGDIGQSLTQFTFLLEVSTATFVFLDKVEENEHKILTSLQDVKSKLFLVVNNKKGSTREEMMSVKTELNLPKTRVKTKHSSVNVADTGKSTLLNTMFGVQFPVSSGRCTRGAYMLFLKVGEDLKSDLNCDFVVLIDTEGLKSPDLAQLEDSYEHDNQLATFVIGLSDVTIINIAMENSTEMKDVLQITAHAFLRMKQIGKKTVCHFVHQNVAGVSAHAKSMPERKHLLDQLNEMTQIAAEMERQPSIKAFTNVLDYDIEKNNWNIPGLWHGTPPMAPVNIGYSVAVANFKQNLLDAVKSDRTNEGYSEKIDESLQQNYRHYKTNSQFEIELKLHICGIASRESLKMHKKFLSENDPQTQLEKYKTQYLSDFLDLYKQRDDCQRKATAFVQLCIKPAVEEYISRSLGVDIVDEILTSCHSAEYSSRSFFQYNIQKELLKKEDFESFVKYIGNYEIYNMNLNVIVKKIAEAIEQASKGEDGVLLPDNKESITELISNMRKYLTKDISLSVEDEKTTLFQIQSPCHPFINSLKISIEDLKKELQWEFTNSEDITETLNKLPIKPRDELFKRVFGCGHQCPFCKVPCEAGGKEHKQHHAAIHRPQGLGRCRDLDTKKLVETLCTTDVHSEKRFSNADTKWEWHPYKYYTKYYPDWLIPPDPTIEASDYWKYVLVQYNDRFAQEYKAKPADVPEAWRRITKEQALKGLKDAFNMK